MTDVFPTAMNGACTIGATSSVVWSMKNDSTTNTAGSVHDLRAAACCDDLPADISTGQEARTASTAPAMTDDPDARAAVIRAVQLRRMARVFGDLGLTSIVGRSWVQAGDEGFVFGGLDDRRFDLLLRALEDLASGVGPSPWVSTAGQLAFPSLDVPGPVWPSAPAASIHMVVPR